MRAIGRVLTVFATLMARKGIVSLEEIADFLGIYAVVAAETAPDEGLMLGCWAGILREAAQATSGDANLPREGLKGRMQCDDAVTGRDDQA